MSASTAALPQPAATGLAANPALVRIAAPTLLGVALLAVWQLVCTTFAVPEYLVPSPLRIALCNRFFEGDAVHPEVAQAVANFALQLQALGHEVEEASPDFSTLDVVRPMMQVVATGVHVLQVEINRSLYVNERSLERSAGFAAIQANMTGLITMLAEKTAELLKG